MFDSESFLVEFIIETYCCRQCAKVRASLENFSLSIVKLRFILIIICLKERGDYLNF